MATWPRATGSAWNSWPTTAAPEGARALVPSGSILAATWVPMPLTSRVRKRNAPLRSRVSAVIRYRTLRLQMVEEEWPWQI